VRNPAGEPARSLYLTNDLVRAVFAANDYKRIRIMAAGTKIFMRQEGGFGRSGDAVQEGAEKVPRFRLLSEGLSVVLPYVKLDSIVDADVPTLRRMLEAYYPLLSAFDDAFRHEVGDKRTCPFSPLLGVFCHFEGLTVGAACKRRGAMLSDSRRATLRGPRTCFDPIFTHV